MKNKEKTLQILERLKNKIENKEGSIDLEVTCFREGEQLVFLLFCNGVVSHYIALKIKDRICYIDKLDSTGYIKGICKDFLRGVVEVIDREIICCFSHPKPAYIFTNAKKEILNPFSLSSLWTAVFLTKCEEVKVWSNNFTELKEKHPKIVKGHPFNRREEVEYFKDDPKTRIKEHLEIRDIDKLFTTLLCRKDFIEGSLIYGLNTRTNNLDFDQLEQVEYPVTEYLKSLDLSTTKKLEAESEKILNIFNFHFVKFKYKKREKEIKENAPTTILKAKRRKR